MEKLGKLKRRSWFLPAYYVPGVLTEMSTRNLPGSKWMEEACDNPTVIYEPIV
jgi:hypothetical protein